MSKQTQVHYTKQWGPDFKFQDFMESNPDAVKVMPNRQLGWQDLLAEIRVRAAGLPTSVYDAACGHGDVARRLFEEPEPPHLHYLGADIHKSLSTIRASARANFINWDISDPLPDSREKFDYVICRAALHHTANPQRTYQSLVLSL